MIKKLNNKGFVVSAVLYTLLIAFLIYLGVTLSTLKSSIDLINHANDDLTNGLPGVKVVTVNGDKKWQVNLAGRLMYLGIDDPSTSSEIDATDYERDGKTYRVFYINNTEIDPDDFTDINDCVLPNCVYIDKSNFDNASLN